MKIKIKKSIAGGHPPCGFSYRPAQVVEFDDKRGAAWIEGGNAVMAEKHEKATAVHPKDPPLPKKETAATPGGDETTAAQKAAAKEAKEKEAAEKKAATEKAKAEKKAAAEKKKGKK